MVTPQSFAVDLDGALVARPSGLPGFASQPRESLGRPALSVEFVDSCRMAFAGLASRMDRGGAIAVCSPHRGEGRTSVAAGLALGIARDTESPVMLLDLDFVRPSLAKVFGIAVTPGLGDFLEEREPLRIVTGGPGRSLCLLPAGSRTGPPARLFHTVLRSDLIAACRERYPWIVLDLPPLLDSPEASLLLALADANLLLGRYCQTPVASLRRTLELLRPDRPTGFLVTSDRSRIPSWIRRLL
jgi:Mrp family chromosome partitioning ATPase